MNNIILCDISNPSRIVPLCLKHGFGIEVQGFYDPNNFTDKNRTIEEHKTMIEPIRLRSLHGCFGDLSAGSFDPMVRDLAKLRFEQSYDIAKELGATHIVFHHGYIPNTSAPSGWLKRASQFWTNFLGSIDSNINIHIENHLDWDPEVISELVSRVNKPNFDICLDIGHAHGLSKTPVITWIEILKDQIGYVHMHDTIKDKDAHLGFGRGTSPIEDVCYALNQYAPNSVWAIETETEYTEESIMWLKEKGMC